MTIWTHEQQEKYNQKCLRRAKDIKNNLIIYATKFKPHLNIPLVDSVIRCLKTCDTYDSCLSFIFNRAINYHYYDLVICDPKCYRLKKKGGEKITWKNIFNVFILKKKRTHKFHFTVAKDVFEYLFDCIIEAEFHDICYYHGGIEHLYKKKDSLLNTYKILKRQIFPVYSSIALYQCEMNSYGSDYDKTSCDKVKKEMNKDIKYYCYNCLTATDEIVFPPKKDSSLDALWGVDVLSDIVICYIPFGWHLNT